MERTEEVNNSIKQTMIPLVDAIVVGDCAQSLDQARNLRESGVTVKEIVVDGIEVAMKRLDEKCTLEQFNLLKIMLTGRASMEVM